MRLTILGAGTAIPLPGFSPAGHLVLIGDQPLIFDIGPGTLSRLAAAGIDYRDLDHLFITHHHSDHTLDLVTLLQDYDSTPGWVRRKPFHLIGCRGTQAFYERLMAAYPGIAPSTYPFEITELTDDHLVGQGWTVQAAPTGHTADSNGYRVEAGGKSIVFSGDAVFSTGLAELAQQADILVCECSFPGAAAPEGHLSASQVGRLAQGARAKRLVLVHLYPPAHRVDLLSQVKEHYGGPVEVAMDGLTIDI